MAALAAVLAAVVALSGDGQAYWLCVPVGLAAASWCATPRTGALALAATIAGGGGATLADSLHGPPLWLALAVPVAAAAIAQRTRARLERERDDLRDFALTDPLTGLANRRTLLAHIEHEAARHRRARVPFALVILDLDGFKTLNDRFGHGAGDELLREVSGALARAMRAQDTVARFGGDEFCVLAPDTDIAGADRVAGRVIAAVSSVTTGTLAVRASVGSAVAPQDGTDPVTLIAVADARLLEAKHELYRAPRSPARRAA